MCNVKIAKMLSKKLYRCGSCSCVTDMKLGMESVIRRVVSVVELLRMRKKNE